MAEARSRDEWSRTAASVWVVAEVNRNRQKRAKPFSPDDFNPWEYRKRSSGKQRLTVGLLMAMKGAFGGTT